MPVPPSLERYFWSANPATLDTEAHKCYIIEQLLEYGNIEALRWMLGAYSNQDIIAILRRTRMLSPKSRCFWALLFHIDLPHDDVYKRSAWHNRNRP